MQYLSTFVCNHPKVSLAAFTGDDSKGVSMDGSNKRETFFPTTTTNASVKAFVVDVLATSPTPSPAFNVDGKDASLLPYIHPPLPPSPLHSMLNHHQHHPPTLNPGGPGGVHVNID